MSPKGKDKTVAPYDFVQQSPSAPTKLLSKLEVLERVPATFPTIWKWMREGKFPRSRDLGGRACWIESEVEAWISSLPLRRYKGDKTEAA